MSIRGYKVEITSLLDINSKTILAQWENITIEQVVEYYMKLNTGKELARCYAKCSKSEISNLKDIQRAETTSNGTVRKLPVCCKYNYV